MCEPILSDGISRCIVDGVVVERIEPRMLIGIEESAYSWCNTNNHRDTERYELLQQQGGTWYSETLEQTSMERWSGALADLCGARLVGSSRLILTREQQRRYFKPARELARAGVAACRLLREESEDLAAELQAQCAAGFGPPHGGWFARTSACSPKDAFHDGGAGPHFSLAAVLRALLASERVQVSMGQYEDDAILYLMPFDTEVTTERELRVFVHERQVTAMSQYRVHSVAPLFANMADCELAAVARVVDAFHRESLAPRWETAGGIASYVMDVELVQNVCGEVAVRLIELNCFGAEMAAASALFHWLRDRDELYSSDRLCIRVLSED